MISWESFLPILYGSLTRRWRLGVLNLSHNLVALGSIRRYSVQGTSSFLAPVQVVRPSSWRAGKMLFSVNIHRTLKYIFAIFRENSRNGRYT